MTDLGQSSPPTKDAIQIYLAQLANLGSPHIETRLIRILLRPLRGPVVSAFPGSRWTLVGH